MYLRKDDILNIENGIILHQVNNKHKMGRGLAKAIKEKYPKHYNDYMASELVLGDIIVTKVDNLIIVGLIAQEGYGTDKRYTDYNYLKECLLKVKKRFLLKGYYCNIYAPYKISCGLGGGNWNTVKDIFSKIIPNIIFVKKD